MSTVGKTISVDALILCGDDCSDDKTEDAIAAYSSEEKSDETIEVVAVLSSEQPAGARHAAYRLSQAQMLYVYATCTAND